MSTSVRIQQTTILKTDYNMANSQFQGTEATDRSLTCHIGLEER